jgi:hypothetical protein
MTSEPQETELYSFGPMGVGICFSRPGFFATIAKNITRVVLTIKRIYGVPQGPFLARAHDNVYVPKGTRS